LANGIREDVLDEKVGGESVTFRVYVFLIKVREASVREVYRGVGLSSPSLALHHLEKLTSLNLAWKDANHVYHVVDKRFGLLRFFHKTGRWLVPRSFVYMILYAAICIGSVLFLPLGMLEVGVTLSAIGFATNLVETVFFLRLIPWRSRSRT
jgi:hypothetical protein